MSKAWDRARAAFIKWSGLVEFAESETEGYYRDRLPEYRRLRDQAADKMRRCATYAEKQAQKDRFWQNCLKNSP